MAEKVLKRSNDKWIAGVCGGLAKYFGVSPILVRVIWILVTIFGFFWLSIIGYIVLVFVLKKE